MKMFERTEILARIRARRRRAIPIPAAGAVAPRCEMRRLWAALSVCRPQHRSFAACGLPTSRIGDSNARTIEMADEIRTSSRDVPVIGGIGLRDPVRLDLERLLDRFWAAGYWVINYPTISAPWATSGAIGGAAGLGFDREVEMISLAQEEHLHDGLCSICRRCD